jgi:hypothetical protein
LSDGENQRLAQNDGFQQKYRYFSGIFGVLMFLQIFYIFLHLFEDKSGNTLYSGQACDCGYPAMVERLGKIISLRVHTIAKRSSLSLPSGNHFPASFPL